MAGSLVNFLYADDSKNICVIVCTYAENNKIEIDDDPVEEDLFLIYDLKNREYFYALANELSFIYE